MVGGISQIFPKWGDPPTTGNPALMKQYCKGSTNERTSNEKITNEKGLSDDMH